MSESAASTELATQAQQPMLFDLPETEAIARLKQFTGEGIRKSDPQKFAAIVAAIGEGISDVAIARAFSPLSANTVAAIRRENQGEIADAKKSAAFSFRQAAQLGVDYWMAELPRIAEKKPETLPIAVGIFTEKAQLLEGEATARVEDVKRVDPDQFNQFIAALPESTETIGLEAGKERTNSAAPVIEAELVEEPISDRT